MKKHIPQYAWFFIGVGMVLMTPHLALAQLVIEQGKVREVVKPGQTLTGSITVHSRAKEEVNVVTYWEDFIYTPPYDGTKKFMPAGTVDNSNAGWVSFSPRQFSLSPFSKRQVNYTINVPAKASGGYYGVLLFEKRGKNEPVNGLAVKIVSRVASLFFLETTDRQKEAELGGFSADGENLKGKIHNSGNVVLVAKGIYYVMDKSGVAVDRGELNGLYLPPSAEGDFSIPLIKELPVGPLTVVLTVDLEDDVSRVAEIDLEKDSDGTYKIIKTRN